MSGCGDYQELTDGIPVESCNLTCEELKDFLVQSGYGSNEAMFNTMLKNGPRGPVCRGCERPIGAHNSSANKSAAQQRQPQRESPAVNETVLLLAVSASREGLDRTPDELVEKFPGTAMYPEHWRGFAWFAPFFQSLGYNGDSTLVRYVGGSSGNQTHAATPPTALVMKHVEWRCIVCGEDGKRCGATFVTNGIYGVEERTRDGASATFAPSERMIRHLREAHGILPPPAASRRGFSTGLFGCCSHLRSTLDFACCFLNIPCGPLLRTYMATTAPNDQQKEPAAHLVRSEIPRKGCVKCDACRIMSVFAYIMLPFTALYATFIVLGGVCSMCGLPCPESVPPLPCSPCYKNRRRLVYELDEDESHQCSKCKVLFCMPCSECQVWREMHYSGIWPGLTCCDANQEELRTMQTETVRQRYGLDWQFWRSSLPTGARDLTAYPGVGMDDGIR